MRAFIRIICPVILAAVLAPLAAAQSEGLPPEWETRKNLQELVAVVGKLTPLLDSLKPDIWAEKGAAPTYAAQLKSARDQMKYLENATTRLSQQPDKMALALETYFRFQALESMVVSVNDAVRRYQNSAIADLIQAQLTELAQYREKLKQYVLALVTTKEQEFSIADKEAQRCREAVAKQPAQPTRKQERK